MERIKRIFNILGPGLLYAGAAIGVSHLVQSTRAGANFGFELIWVIIVVHLIKYPFFEFAPRYANATGKSLLHGYRDIGKIALVLYVLLTISTMFAIQAAITSVTAGIVAHVFGIELSMVALCAIILIITMLILAVGKFRLLDNLMKFIILLLAISTIIAVIRAFGISNPAPEHLVNFDWMKRTDILFLIAFIGWMPAPIDVSVWHSLWSVAKMKENKERSMKNALLDFRTGYIGTGFLAMGFLALGALVMYGSGETLSAKGVVFAGQLIEMYTSSMGGWAYWIIIIAVLTTMVSTTITVMDAYPRVLKGVTEMSLRKKTSDNRYYWFWIIVLVIGTLILLGYLSASMRFMVDLATTISFVTAPLLAILNYLVVTGKHMPEDARPGAGLRYYALAGIIILCGFSLFYLFYVN
jgi:Mn2+/Fe2+ NRAMP family transporter